MLAVDPLTILTIICVTVFLFLATAGSGTVDSYEDLEEDIEPIPFRRNS